MASANLQAENRCPSAGKVYRNVTGSKDFNVGQRAGGLFGLATVPGAVALLIVAKISEFFSPKKLKSNDVTHGVVAFALPILS